MKKSQNKFIVKIRPVLHNLWDFGLSFIPKPIFAHMILAICENKK
ncbi:MAG: hypothetical protein RMJ67_05895 [Elusimicrobiota bacterium]|nr:hypothetical protein [Endomicrobiia bacterium]MDW8166024.1 hypothetical protein [Elusimicrobiota bacterium]